MSYATEYELEQEFEAELAHELQSGASHETHEMHEAHEAQEAEAEAELFFQEIGRMARRRRPSPALRKLGLRVGRSALVGLGRVDDDGDDDDGDFESGAHELHELNPVRKVYSDAMLEHLGHAAATAESEDEAVNRMLPLIPMVASKLGSVVVESEMHRKPAAPRVAAAAKVVGNSVAKAVGHAVGKALGPAAGRAAAHTAARAAVKTVTQGRPMVHAVHARPGLAPKVHQAVTRAAPHLTRGIGHVTRTLYRNPQTRPLLHVIPSIARSTTAAIARKVAHGQTVTPRQAVQTLARQTAHALGSPQTITRAWKTGKRLDHHLHRHLVPGTHTTRYLYGQPGYVAPRPVNYIGGSGPRYVTGPASRTAIGTKTGGYAAPAQRYTAPARNGRGCGCGCNCGCACPHCGR